MASKLHGGTVIRRVRLYKHMTQDDVCQLLPELNKRTLQRWECLQTEPSFSDIMTICELAFKLPIGDAVVIAEYFNF